MGGEEGGEGLRKTGWGGEGRGVKIMNDYINVLIILQFLGGEDGDGCWGRLGKIELSWGGEE